MSAGDVKVGDRIVIYDRVCEVTDIRPPFMDYIAISAGSWRMNYLPTTMVVLVDRRAGKAV